MPERNLTRVLHTLVFAALIPATAWSDVIYDGSLNAAGGGVGSITDNGFGDFTIPQNVGVTQGSNLFHSFSEFNIATGGSATFQSAGISNIISRISDTNPSSIDGQLIAGANLFLINPNGVLFGENASLDVDGSFHVSTADYLKLGNDGVFYADVGTSSTLTSSAPSAFGFLSGGTATIELQESWLFQDEGESISFVANEVDIHDSTGWGSKIQAPNANINIIAVNSAGEATLSNDKVDASSFNAMGDIAISDSYIFAHDNTWNDTANGTINIQGGNITITNSDLRSENDAAIDGATAGAFIDASGHLEIDNSQIWIDSAGGGDAGSLIINANTMTATNGAWLSSDALDAGNAGDVSISVNGALLLDWGALVSSDAYDAGHAGSISITADNATLDNGAWVSSDVQGSATTGTGGSINLYIADTLTLDGTSYISTDTFSDGYAGFMEIEADNANILNGSYISSDTTAWGDAGYIRLLINDTLTLDNSSLSSDTTSDGWAGAIGLTASTINVINGTTISSDTTDWGRAGYIDLEADTLNVFDSTISSDTHADGLGGYIDLYATNTINVDNSTISSGAGGDGDAGYISLVSPGTININDSYLSSEAYWETAWDAIGNAGYIYIAGNNTNITDSFLTSETDDAGDAGYIYLNTSDTVNINNSTLITNTYSDGDSGYIYIRADNNANITNSSEISSDTGSNGDASSVTLAVTNTLTIDNSEISSQAYWYDSEDALGSAGLIRVRAGEATVRNGSLIISNSDQRGDAGDIVIETTNGLSVSDSTISSDTNFTGDAGTIRISANGISLDAANITSISDYPGYNPTGPQYGDAGTVTLTSGSSLNMGNGSTISSATNTDGNAGNVSITTGSLSLNSGSKITSETAWDGNGGSISILASGQLTMNGNSEITAGTSDWGNGGDVDISANRIDLNDSSINSNSTLDSLWAGNAGNISMVANDIIELDNSTISTKAVATDGGNIEITVNDMLYLFESGISTEVGTGNGAGGNITIDPIFVVLYDSYITANAFGGPGGNINITTDYLITNQASSITASSALGVDGLVSIDTLETDTSGDLAALPTSYLDASKLMASNCGSASGNASTLMMLGDSGRVGDPAALQRTTLLDLQGLGTTTAATSTNQYITAAGGVSLAQLPPFMPGAGSCRAVN